jgi:hypothetical protein
MAGRLRLRIRSGVITAPAPGVFARMATADVRVPARVLLTALLLILSWAPGGCTTTGDGAAARLPGVEALDARFRKLAFEQLAFKLERSRPLSPPAQQAIEEFIATGARRLAADGATPERISAAEKNLARFISRLSENADVGEQGEISAETVAAARKQLCPLYPFC